MQTINRSVSHRCLCNFLIQVLEKEECGVTIWAYQTTIGESVTFVNNINQQKNEFDVRYIVKNKNIRLKKILTYNTSTVIRLKIS